ncbi:hypothetical protein M9435_003694 [Picochlorum sp. BPE23]|nr:hypothetical protein M9435_003694 [Picochlorum sp. BPE23]
MMYLSTPVVKSTGFQHPKILKITSERRGIRRRGNDRAVLPPRAILADAATAELAAVFGGVALSGAALCGLAMAIRDANGFDERDERLMAERMGLKEEAKPAAAAVVTDVVDTVKAAEPEPPAPIAEKKDETTEEQKEKEVVLPDPVEVEARVNTVQAWIGAWKDKSAQLAAEAERKAKEAEAKAIEAQRRVLEAEKELARAEAEEDRKKRVAHVRAWIDSWREASAKRAAAAAAPSLDPNPGMAAAVIKEMTEDTPVGVQRSTPVVEEKAPAMVSATTEDSSSGTTKETEAAPKQRRVSITAEYETKINSLLSNYNASQERKKNMLPRETVTVNQEEMAAAEKEQAIKKANPIVLFFLRIVAMIQACFAFIKSLITGSGGDSEGPSTVAA